MAWASLISRNDGVSVTGRLSHDGLSSTVIKTQQMNSLDQNRQPNSQPRTYNAKNDNSHFRLFYKSNSPGRSIKHEMEHRFYKNPNFQMNPPQQPQYLPNGYNPFLNMLNENSYPQNTQNIGQNIGQDNDMSTMLNLHYHDNPDYANANSNFNQLLKQQQLQIQRQKQQQQREQYQQMHKKNLLKMMLSNFVSAQASNNQYKQANEPNRNANNGVQYKIVNLKFRIEPQHGKLVGQGIVGTNNGAGGILNSQHFNLWPNELPALVKSIISNAQQQQYEKSFGYGVSRFSHGTLKKKREDEGSEEQDDSTLEKRALNELRDDEESTDSDAQRKRRSSEYEESQVEEAERQRRNEEEDESDSVSDEKVNDNDFKESFQSLQRRDDELGFDGGDEEADPERQERNYEDSEDLDNEEGGDEHSAINEQGF